MIRHGDCLDVMAGMDPESVDAIVTDPPYGLEFMGKEWDRLGGAGFHAPKDEGRTFTNASGHMYDNLKSLPRFGRGAGMQAFHARWAEAAYRVAKPSSYLLAFGGTRTVHRMTVALEDAGWIIRDMLVWAYASGFPKSKASLKPAWEPIVMARKPGPLRMLNIDECRIPESARRWTEPRGMGFSGGTDHGSVPSEATEGRWPANVVLTDPIFDGGWDGVVGGGETTSGKMLPTDVRSGDRTVFGSDAAAGYTTIETYGDSGTYSRFFIIPKADRADREPVLGGQLTKVDVFRGHQPDNPRCLTCGRQRIGPLGAPACECEEPDWAVVGDKQRENSHPTVKPTDLMRHLVRLVTPAGGVVLDPFLGSGTTGLAAEMEGFAWVGIEREAEYVAIAEARLNGTQRGLGLGA